MSGPKEFAILQVVLAFLSRFIPLRILQHQFQPHLQQFAREQRLYLLLTEVCSVQELHGIGIPLVAEQVMLDLDQYFPKHQCLQPPILSGLKEYVTILLVFLPQLLLILPQLLLQVFRGSLPASVPEQLLFLQEPAEHKGLGQSVNGTLITVAEHL